MAGSTQTTASLSQEVSTYYEKRFLSRAEPYLVHAEGGQKRSHPGAEGRTVRFTRYTPLSVSTTALTEGTTPAITDLTATNVDAILSEYGNSIKVSKFLSVNSIDERDREKVDVVSENMGKTLDQLVRDELFATTQVQLAGGKSLISDIAASNTLSAAELRKAIRALESSGAPRYSGTGQYLGKIQPYTKFDFTGDSTWVNAAQYSNVDALYKGELGMMYGIRLLLTNNGKSESSTVTVYSNFVHGAEAFGVVEHSQDPPKLYIVPSGSIDSGNPAARFGYISWAGSYVCKLLNANFVVNVKTGATA
jgi:N4-gp56 family major capsid protein